MNDFDSIIDRRSTNSIKWRLYGDDVLPLWVADMDFASPKPIKETLIRAVEHGIYGYEFPTKELRETVAARMNNLYGWHVSPEWVVATPGVIAGFTAAARTVCREGQGILVQPPVYPPFLMLHKFNRLTRQDAILGVTSDGTTLQYDIDFDKFEKAINSGGAQTGMFLLCNPHNPTGQMYSRDELIRMAEFCLRNNTFICSDEIHSELTLGNSSTSSQGKSRHVPIASLSPEIADRTITLVAPSKTFNVPGLFCGFAIISNREMLNHYKETVEQMGLHINSLGLSAAKTAFSGVCDDWLGDLRTYLTANRDFLIEYVKSELKGIKTTYPQATYFAWMDCVELIKSGRIKGTPHEFFLKRAKVALNEGNEFGLGGEGFARLNFGCPRKILEEALNRMKVSLT